jgi:uncharacterized protein involved in response to NO
VKNIKTLQVLFADPFRPFFLAAAVYACLSIGIWTLYLIGPGEALVPAGQLPTAWHAHEMLFGYLSAVLAGFLLTAIPNWTGRQGVKGGNLAALFTVWFLGRIASGFYWQSVDAVVVDCAFLFLLAAYSWSQILAAGNRRNLIICVLVTVLAASNVWFYAEALLSHGPAYSQRTALAVLAMLMSVVGGRVTANFTSNWLKARNAAKLPAEFDRFDGLCLLFTLIALVSWVVLPQSKFSAALLMVAGVLHLIRLTRWRGWSAYKEPLLWILHIGYLWLTVALLLLGAQVILPQWFPGTMGIHALTAGAAGVLPIAVMTRATLGHTGRQLSAGRATTAIYLLIILGALIRVLAPYSGDGYLNIVAVGALFWTCGFLGFCVVYGRFWIKPRLGT